ncbi:bifunctional phosphoribosyl-AMP cyclohydrolase/phosphoribosyl-ATP diphosphatase HisIE [Parafilimonas terrae]|uniref:Histidine biosynthesis bifunctional protein HisIE n=1 Tax=Parafilimonas terrae TaxID=1465490 RepID=A0A1I5SJK0_9BACT|nr:bifunctional phosphoribosyl-AMP cyclohydrolase/phosphoribosyl-ATP diphosphatase HisIE [Parafilimonas terrae]SFP70888.1 phosphoribosyl-ATP pyrophosphatase /phosphoribosyl-AMP cyclohydrolase [Parafilimonas terrae]
MSNHEHINIPSENGGIKPDFNKFPDKLVPVIVQDALTNKVLMLGYMDEAAYNKTIVEEKVTFFSRSKQRLWTKGETSGNFLLVKEILQDCDNDCLLVKANPVGPVCHTGADTCFNETNEGSFLQQLEKIIQSRKETRQEGSYVNSLFKKGINKIAQKVGEEAVEVVIEAKDDNEGLFKNEAADLLFHYLILLNAKGMRLNDIIKVLEARHAAGPNSLPENEGA